MSTKYKVILCCTSISDHLADTQISFFFFFQLVALLTRQIKAFLKLFFLKPIFTPVPFKADLCLKIRFQTMYKTVSYCYTRGHRQKKLKVKTRRGTKTKALSVSREHGKR